MLEQSVVNWIAKYGYLGVFSLEMLGVLGIPLSGELLLAFVGFLVYRRVLLPTPALAAAFLGSITGMTVDYILGRGVGGAANRYNHLIRISPERLNRATHWMNSNGKWGLFFGYFVPGMRHVIALTAGAARFKYRTFALFSYTGGFLWCVIFILVGYLAGKDWSAIEHLIHHYIKVVFGAVALSLVIYFLWKRRSE